MKILLVQPFKDTGLGFESYPPVGLGYLAGMLIKNNHVVKILDCLKDLHDYQGFKNTVNQFSPDLIGINLFSISVPYVEKMIAMVKEQLPKISVVLGGPHVSSLPDTVLKYFTKADYAIRGEGEVPLVGLVNYLESGSVSLNNVAGLIYRSGDKIVMNEPYFAKDIQEYGIPAWDLIKPQEYFKFLSMNGHSAPVFFSRGCPFPCTFCAARVTSGQALRRRGLDHIFKELYFLQEKFDIKRFIIEDEGFGVSKRFIMAFCERVREERFKAKFMMGVGMRLNIIDEELLFSMKESNFERTIALGIESGSERVLKLMKKKIGLSMVWEKAKLMDKMGFEPTGYFILGYPGETREEMNQTIELAMRLPIREASFTAFQPLPGTEATKLLIENKELAQDFDFTTLAPNKIAYAPKGMSAQELEQIRKNAILRFYLKPKNFFRYLRSTNSFVFAFKKLLTVFLKSNTIGTYKPKFWDKPDFEIKETNSFIGRK